MKKTIMILLALCLILAAIAVPVLAAEADAQEASAANVGVVTVAAVTALCYLVGLIVKATKLDNKWIPVICGLAGIALGITALYTGVPDFPAADPITAAAVGAVSGLAATGMDQAVKQLTQ